MEDQEKLYKAGFNIGYLISKYEPELATKILDSVKPHNNDYCSGLVVGHDTYIMERIIEQNKEQNKGVDKNSDILYKDKDDRDKDDR